MKASLVKARVRTVCGLLVILGMLVASIARAADNAAALREEPQLLAILGSESAPEADKAMACKELAVRGSAAAAPALGPLLANDHLASWARIALEAIPDPACDRVLRDAIAGERLSGRLLVGVIHSLGVRRDAEAAALLVPLLGHADPAVASAAAVSLGRIGGAKGTAALVAGLSHSPEAVRSAIAEALIARAEAEHAAGDAAEAVALYDRVRGANLPEPRIIEATRGAILARGEAGIPLLLEQLRSPERRRMNIGLSVARELPGEAVDRALAREFAGATAERAERLASVLGDRGGAAAREALAAVVTREDAPVAVRLAALGGLARIGDASSVAAVLGLVAGGDAALAAASVAAAGEIQGPGVDEAIVAALARARGSELASLLAVVGRRRITAAGPQIAAAVGDPDPAVRAAAIAALGATADLEGLGVLVTRALTPGGDADGAVAALRAAAVRMPDREACARRLAAAVRAAGSDAARVAVLDILGEMGGEQALDAVADAAASDDEALRDAGTRLLGAWMTADAAAPLLRLAESLPDGKYRTRAFRGSLRVARQLVKEDAERLAMCRKALALVRSPDDRRQVLEALRLVPTPDALRLAADVATDEVRDDARSTAAAILQKMGEPTEEAWELAGRLGLARAKVEIVNAIYGSAAKVKDVTEMVRKRLAGVAVIALGSPSYNSSFGGDPAPGEPKRLVIRYVLDGRPGEATFPEDAPIVLPVPAP
jgi:HEAT repeat protein